MDGHEGSKRWRDHTANMMHLLAARPVVRELGGAVISKQRQMSYSGNWAHAGSMLPNLALKPPQLTMWPMNRRDTQPRMMRCMR